MKSTLKGSVKRVDLILVVCTLGLAVCGLVASEPQEKECRRWSDQDEQLCTVMCNGTAKLSAMGRPLCIEDKTMDVPMTTTCICGELVGGMGIFQQGGEDIPVRSDCHAYNISDQSHCPRCINQVTDVQYECQVTQEPSKNQDALEQSFSSAPKKYCACASSFIRERSCITVGCDETANSGVGVGSDNTGGIGVGSSNPGVGVGSPAVGNVAGEQTGGRRRGRFPAILAKLLEALKQVRSKYN